MNRGLNKLFCVKIFKTSPELCGCSVPYRLLRFSDVYFSPIWNNNSSSRNYDNRGTTYLIMERQRFGNVYFWLFGILVVGVGGVISVTSLELKGRSITYRLLRFGNVYFSPISNNKIRYSRLNQNNFWTYLQVNIWVALVQNTSLWGLFRASQQFKCNRKWFTIPTKTYQYYYYWWPDAVAATTTGAVAATITGAADHHSNRNYCLFWHDKQHSFQRKL